MTSAATTPSPHGRAGRRGRRPKIRTALREAIAYKAYEFDAHGVEHNQRYASSEVVSDGTPMPEYRRDPVLYAQATTWPGAKISHTWVTVGGRRTSTLDLVGHGRFGVVTGIGGEAWLEAAVELGAELGLTLTPVSIGPGRLVEDPYGTWADLREIEDAGVLLVRPDLCVAARHQGARASPAAARDWLGGPCAASSVATDPAARYGPALRPYRAANSPGRIPVTRTKSWVRCGWSARPSSAATSPTVVWMTCQASSRSSRWARSIRSLSASVKTHPDPAVYGAGRTPIAALYESVNRPLSAVLEAVPEEAWAKDSPCSGWTARDVVRHLVTTQRDVLAQHGVDPGEEPDVDRDPAAAWQEHARRVLAALSDEAVAGRGFDGFFGPTTVGAALDQFHVWDMVVCRWDVARATGGDTDLADAELDRVERGADAFGEALYMEGICRPAVEAPAGADRAVRVLARLGRV